MGSFFELMITREFLARVKRHTWQGVSCTMLQSQVKEMGSSDQPYVLQVEPEQLHGLPLVILETLFGSQIVAPIYRSGPVSLSLM